MACEDLTYKFRKWYKGSNKIVRITQKDNSIFVIFYNKDSSKYNVGNYKYGQNADGLLTFNLVELEESMDSQEAFKKFYRL
jgi:hypothetical protein